MACILKVHFLELCRVS